MAHGHDGILGRIGGPRQGGPGHAFGIEARADGIYCMTSPRGAPATPFRLVEQSDRRLVFENAGHDFPQRILYWSRAPGELRARIEGTLHGRPEST